MSRGTGSRTGRPVGLEVAQATGNRPGLPVPLSRAERERVEGVLRRLRIEVGAVLTRVSRGTDSTSALARELEVDRVTAHRVRTLCGSRGGELPGVALAPGVEGVSKFLDAAERQDVDQQVMAAARVATEGYARLIREVGGSKAKLEARIEATLPTAGGQPEYADREQRERVFSAAASLLGREMGVRLDLSVIRRSPKGAELMDYANVRGYLGHRARADAAPFAAEFLGKVEHGDEGGPEFLTLDGQPARGAVDRAVLEEFSTMPPPVVTSQGRGDRMKYVIDPGIVRGGEAVDIVVGHLAPGSFRDPRLDDEPAIEVGALVREPTRALVLDMFVERELAIPATPSLEVYIWSPTIGNSLADHWLDRLPSGPPLEVILPGSCRLHPRQDELTEQVFGRLGWDPGAFVGYRCQVEYPLWGGAYFIALNYSGEHERAS